MRKILFLGRFPPPVHGAALMNQNYFEELRIDKGLYIKRIQINYSKSLEELGKVNLKKFFGFFVVLFKVVYENLFFRPEIVYFELAPRGFAFYRDSIYVLICKMFRKKIIFHFQAKGISLLKEKRFSKVYAQWIFNNTKVILLSKLLHYDVKNFVKKKEVYVIPNSIKDRLSDKEFRKIVNSRDNNDKVCLLFLSNMIESKGPIGVLEICAQLKQRKVHFICNFVGAFSDDSFKEKFIQKIKALGLEDDCIYLGPLYDKEKFEVLEKTDYLVFPTCYKNEVFPLILLEALMYGIPCFTYDNAAIPEIISKPYLGFVARQKDQISLFEELLKRILKRDENPFEIRKEFKAKYQLSRAVKKIKRVLI